MSGAFPAKAAVVTGPPDKQARIRWMVDEYLDFVARTLRKAGVPAVRPGRRDPADLHHRRPPHRRRGPGRGAELPVSGRRSTWRRTRGASFARRREVMDDRTPERVEALATPEHLTNRKQMRELLDDIVGGMDASLRTVFLLHEIEEMNLTEIAAHLRVPRGTVASRLRRAREQIRSTCAPSSSPGIWGRRPGSAWMPMFLRRETSSPFGRALLETASSRRPRRPWHEERTVLGLVVSSGADGDAGVTSRRPAAWTSTGRLLRFVAMKSSPASSRRGWRSCWPRPPFAAPPRAPIWICRGRARSRRCRRSSA